MKNDPRMAEVFTGADVALQALCAIPADALAYRRIVAVPAEDDIIKISALCHAWWERSTVVVMEITRKILFHRLRLV